MALVSRLAAKRVEIPHEPGQWMEFKPPSWGVVKALKEDGGGEGLLLAGITAWSYGPEVSEAMVADLDMRTLTWAVGEVMKLSGLAKEGEALAAVSKSIT